MFRPKRDHLQEIKVSKIVKKRHCVKGGLCVNVISLVQLIGLYERVTGVFTDVFTCRFCNKWISG